LLTSEEVAMLNRRSIAAGARPLVLVVASLALLPGSPAVGSPGAPGAPAVESVISAGATLIPRLDGTLEVIRGDQRELLTLADGAEVTKITPAPEPEPEESTLYICYDSRWDPQKNPKRVMYPPVPVAGETGAGHIQYVFTVFRLEEARRYSGQWHRQFEACARGLGQSDAEHWRMEYAGATEADIGSKFSRIGWEYRTGETPPKYTLTYGFAVGTKMCAGVPAAKACSDSSISAAIEQVASGELTGGFKAPVGELRPAWENGVAGWWSGAKVGGAPAFQSHGTVLHALWEYKADDTKSMQPALYAEVYAKFKCSRWMGLGCAVEPGGL
jgi:hypothetical protein